MMKSAWIVVQLLLTITPASLNDIDITEAAITSFAKNFSLLRRSFDQNLNQINLFLQHGAVATFRRAQSANNATDMLLDHLDRAIITESRRKTHEVIIKPFVIVQTFHLRATQIIGLALHKAEAETKAPRIEEIVLPANPNDLLTRTDCIAAIYLPFALRKQILATRIADPVVVVTVFLKDSLFVETTASPRRRSTGIVFSVLIPDFHDAFAAPIRVVHRVDAADVASKRCAHWLYGSAIRGSWQEENTASFCAGVEICDFDHVTHFGLLITSDADAHRVHKTALDIITIVGCFLSLVGIAGIITTALLFRQWRANKGNIILTNYALATLMEIVLLYASGQAKAKSICNGHWCFWSGFFLHYVVLAQFFWVLVISYLQYKRYVEILGDVISKLVLKSCLVGWGAPFAIVLPFALIFPDGYINSHAAVCYPSGLLFYLAVLLPIVSIVSINVIIFALIVKSLFEIPSVRSTRIQNQTFIKFRLLILLFFQLGLSWIFGFLGSVHVSFMYLFCLTATMQGFVVFVLFIFLNQPTRQMYVKLVTGKSDQSRETTSKSTGITSTTEESVTRIGEQAEEN